NSGPDAADDSDRSPTRAAGRTGALRRAARYRRQVDRLDLTEHVRRNGTLRGERRLVRHDRRLVVGEYRAAGGVVGCDPAGIDVQIKLFPDDREKIGSTNFDARERRVETPILAVPFPDQAGD